MVGLDGVGQVHGAREGLPADQNANVAGEEGLGRRVRLFRLRKVDDFAVGSVKELPPEREEIPHW